MTWSSDIHRYPTSPFEDPITLDQRWALSQAASSRGLSGVSLITTVSSFLYSRRWRAPQPLHKLHEGEARASTQSSTKRTPRHQPPSQLGGHPPRVTSSQSLTRTNRGRELNTMQGCKARTPKVFKSFILKSHQSNKC